MGRWINKLNNTPNIELTKLTEPGFVGFVSTKSRVLENFVTRCCEDLEVSASKVIDDLLSTDDEKDILNGDITEQEVIWIIKLWLKDGAKHKSGKQHSSGGQNEK